VHFLSWCSPTFFPGLKPKKFAGTFIALAKASAPTPKGVGFHLSGLQQFWNRASARVAGAGRMTELHPTERKTEKRARWGPRNTVHLRIS
jgi:hypothetical protein